MQKRHHEDLQHNWMRLIETFGALQLWADQYQVFDGYADLFDKRSQIRLAAARHQVHLDASLEALFQDAAHILSHTNLPIDQQERAFRCFFEVADTMGEHQDDKLKPEQERTAYKLMTDCMIRGRIESRLARAPENESEAQQLPDGEWSELLKELFDKKYMTIHVLERIHDYITIWKYRPYPKGFSEFEMPRAVIVPDDLYQQLITVFAPFQYDHAIRAKIDSYRPLSGFNPSEPYYQSHPTYRVPVDEYRTERPSPSNAADQKGPQPNHQSNSVPPPPPQYTGPVGTIDPDAANIYPDWRPRRGFGAGATSSGSNPEDMPYSGGAPTPPRYQPPQSTYTHSGSGPASQQQRPPETHTREKKDEKTTSGASSTRRGTDSRGQRKSGNAEGAKTSGSGYGPNRTTQPQLTAAELQLRTRWAQILGVAITASKDEIKKAYRKKAQSCHPDVSSNATAQRDFQELNEARTGMDKLRDKLDGK